MEVAELAVFGAAELDEEDELLVAVAMAAGFTDGALFEDAACAALTASWAAAAEAAAFSWDDTLWVAPL